MTVVVGLIVLISTIWVGVDASGRDWTGNRVGDAAWKWPLGMLALWILVFPLYLVHRRRVPRDGTGGRPPQRVGVDRATFDAPERPSSVPPPGMS